MFALPSKFEGMPLVAVEAQACGAACVLSDLISTEADVGNTKFLPIDDAKLWAKTISDLLDVNKKTVSRETLAKAGYDITKEAPKLLTYYQKIVNE